MGGVWNWLCTAINHLDKSPLFWLADGAGFCSPTLKSVDLRLHLLTQFSLFFFSFLKNIISLEIYNKKCFILRDLP